MTVARQAEYGSAASGQNAPLSTHVTAATDPFATEAAQLVVGESLPTGGRPDTRAAQRAEV